MKKINGIVEEVYIPFNKDQDIMLSNKIGFKVKTKDEVYQIEEEQNEFNSEILKGDKVIITKQIISNIEFLDIEKLESEDNE